MILVTDISAPTGAATAGQSTTTRTPRQRDQTAKAAETRRSTSIGTTVARALPWVAVAAFMIAALLWSGTPRTSILRYGAYWAGGVIVPGTLVFRALRGSRGNLPEDVGFGAVTGFAVQLIGWALAVGTGLGGWLRVWPVLVILVFALVPGLRRHWSLSSSEPMRLAAAWTLAGIMILAITTLATIDWGGNPLPPATHTLFEDVYYHWANAAELRRTITPQQPQMAGEPLIYHWFSDAYRASATMISGAPLSQVMLRLWVGPVVVTSILVIAGLGRQVAKVWWAGPVAAFVATLLPVTSIWPAFASWPVTILPWYSPTLTFSIPVVTAVIALLVDVCRGVRLGRGGWVLFGLLLPLATASKSSSLPVLFGGVCLAVLASWIINRRPPWTVLAALGGAILTLAVTAPTLAGGAAGAGLQIGAGFTFKSEFAWVYGKKYIAGTGGLLPPEWLQMPWGLRWILPALILCFILSQIGRVVGFTALLRRSIRRDVAAWLLAGVGIAGWAGALLINHTANGELYFAYSAIPAEAALTAWLIASLAPARRTALWVIGGVALGWITGLWLERFGPGRDRAPWATYWRYDLARPVIALAVIVLAGVVLWWLVRLRGRAVMAGAGLAVLVAGTIGLGIDTTYRAMAGGVSQVASGALPSTGTKGTFWVNRSEMVAAAWLANHAPTKDVIATNIHCEMVKTTGDCVNRSFWVGAITEHAVVLEGWAYQPSVQAKHGDNGLPYFKQPAPDLERLRINDAAFTNPTAAGLAELRDKYGAKWLYADTRATVVSPELARLATVRYQAGTVTIYELPKA